MRISSHSLACVTFLREALPQPSKSRKWAWLSSPLSMGRVFLKLSLNTQLAQLTHPTLILVLLSFFSWLEVPFKSGLSIQPISSLLRHYQRAGWYLCVPKGTCALHTMLMHKYLLQRLQHLGVQMLEPFQFPTLCSLLALTMLSWLNPSRPILPPLKLLRLV